MPKVRQRENLKNSKRKTVIYKEAPRRLSAEFSPQTLCRPDGIGKKYSNWWKAETYNQDYSTHQRYHLEIKDR